MTKHPLTNKMCWEIADTEDRTFSSIERDNMRSAADWQLEQVMKWLGKNLYNYTDDTYLGDMSPMHMLDDDLKEAMRPTKEKNK